MKIIFFKVKDISNIAVFTSDTAISVNEEINIGSRKFIYSLTPADG